MNLVFLRVTRQYTSKLTICQQTLFSFVFSPLIDSCQRVVTRSKVAWQIVTCAVPPLSSHPPLRNLSVHYRQTFLFGSRLWLQKVRSIVVYGNSKLRRYKIRKQQTKSETILGAPAVEFNSFKGSKLWWMVTARLCEKARLAFYFASPRHFDLFHCATQTSNCFKYELRTFRRYSR